MAGKFDPPKEFKPESEAGFFLSLFPHILQGNGDAHEAMLSEVCRLSPEQAKQTIDAMAGIGVISAGSNDPIEKIVGLYGTRSLNSRLQFSSIRECLHKGR